VVWNIFYFPILKIRIPTDELHHFSEGFVGSTTKQISFSKTDLGSYIIFGYLPDVPIELFQHQELVRDSIRKIEVIIAVAGTYLSVLDLIQ
jgi:hypothetical protein